MKIGIYGGDLLRFPPPYLGWPPARPNGEKVGIVSCTWGFSGGYCGGIL